MNDAITRAVDSRLAFATLAGKARTNRGELGVSATYDVRAIFDARPIGFSPDLIAIGTASNVRFRPEAVIRPTRSLARSARCVNY